MYYVLASTTYFVVFNIGVVLPSPDTDNMTTSLQGLNVELNYC
jgi:hypothetical protein